jgi:hypothetical protein
MSHHPSGPSSKPPSDPPRQSLLIQTSMPPSQPNPQRHQPSPSRQPQQQLQQYPIYPLPVPDDKYEKAVALLGKLRIEEGLAQRSKNSRHYGNSTLGVPGIKPNSIKSEPRTASGTTSNYGGPAESILSFEDESPSSAANGTADPTSFDGKKVKTRKRAPLTPVTRRRAALIRHLGSCWVCRSRRVPCPLEHHDIAALENGLRARPRPRSSTTPEPTRPTFVGTTPQRNISSPSRLSRSAAVPDDFVGLGSNPVVLQIPVQDPVVDATQSPMFTDDDPLFGIEAGPMDFSELDLSDSLNVPGFGAQDPYSAYQNAAMIELGVWNGWGFQCGYLGGCQQTFPDEELLQSHFEIHFAYNRLLPPDRYVCPSCSSVNTFDPHMCYSCGLGVLEHRIYGTFIRNNFYQRESPDGQDLSFGRNQMEPFSFFTMLPPNDNTMGPSTGNSGSSGMNQGGYFQNNNMFQAPGPNSSSSSQGKSFDNFNSPQSGGYHFRGSEFGEAGDPTLVRYWFAKTLQKCRRHKLMLIAAALLLTATLIVETHDWFMAQARVAQLQPNLPIIAGFIGLVASFALCHTFWTMKHSARERRSQWVCAYTTPAPSSRFLTPTQRSAKCPINDLSASASLFRCAPVAPPSSMRGGIYL